MSELNVEKILDELDDLRNGFEEAKGTLEYIANETDNMRWESYLREQIGNINDLLNP